MANANRHIKHRDLLRRYLSGEIDANGEAELFAAAGEDEALAEALTGYQQQPEADHQASLNKLRAKLPSAERKRLIPLKAISIAASLLLLVTVVFYGYQSSNDYATAAEAAPMADSKTPRTDEKSTETEGNTEAYTKGSPTAGSDQPATVSPPKDAEAKRTNTPKAVPKTEMAETLRAQNTPATAGRVSADTPAPTSPPPPSPAMVTAEPEPDMAEEEVGTFEEAMPPADAFAGSTDRRRADKKTSSAANRPSGVRVISGFVTDEQDRPITNASITLPGLPIGESTDSSGYFEFVADQTIRQLQVGHPDFESSEIQLPRNENELVINLSKPAGFNEDELDDDWLMTGARTTIYPNAEKTSATVRGGMRALRRDMEAARPENLPAGVVKVSFSVQADGSLTDFDFGRKSEEQLIDFVRNYLQQNSQWELRGGDTPTRMAITFRFAP